MLHDPLSCSARGYLALRCLNSGLLDEADAALLEALRLSPRAGLLPAVLGTLRLEQQRPQEALASYDRALTIKPEHVTALNNRGNAMHTLARYEEALASYDRALAIKPDYADALCNRGNALLLFPELA